MELSRLDSEKAAFFVRLASIPLLHELLGMTPDEFADAMHQRRFRIYYARGVIESDPETAATVFSARFGDTGDVHEVAAEDASWRFESGLHRRPAKELGELTRLFVRMFPNAERDRRFVADDARHFDNVHSDVRSFFVDLFNPASSGPAKLFRGGQVGYRLTPTGAVVVSSDADTAITDLARLVTSRPFPFGRCLNCANFFVRHGRQVHCSEQCRIDRNENARRGQRTAYMRDLMRRKREREAARRNAKAKTSSKRRRAQ